MNIFRYIKQRGLKTTLQVIYRYKINELLEKILGCFLKHKPLKDIICIESHNDFDCNGGPFYEYLIKNGYNKKYKIVWYLKNPYHKSLPNNVDKVYLSKPSIKKSYYKYMAKYFISDNNCEAKLRKDQVSLHLGHGAIALKNTKGMLPIPSDLDYITCPSEEYKHYFAYKFILDEDDPKLIYTGYPVHDILYGNDPGDLHKLTNFKYNKVILWMPTFRKGGGFGRNDSNVEQALGIPLIKDIEEFNVLNAYLAKNNCLLIIKIHPMQDMSVLHIKDTSNIKVLTGKSVKELGIDNYRLMKDTDALISDYSSSSYDYLHLNRPIGYVFDDLENYKLGLIVDDLDHYIAGDKIMNFQDMQHFIDKIVEEKDDKKNEREELLKRLFTYRDGHSCERIVKLLGIEI